LVIKPKCNLLIPSLGIPEFHQSQLKNQIPRIVPNFQLCSPFKNQHRQEHGGGRYTTHKKKNTRGPFLQQKDHPPTLENFPVSLPP